MQRTLLQEDKLIWSPVVANSNMNRERKASGINSYEQEFGFRPQDFLMEKVQEQGTAAWLDLCCGQGNALIQTAAALSGAAIAGDFFLKGIDLVDQFGTVLPGNVLPVLEVASVTGWIPDRSYDLITCSHGIHYLGDKLKALQTMLAALATGGLFVANFDVESILADGKSATALLLQLFKIHSIVYHKRKRILTCRGPVVLQTGLTYLGADDQAGPNYTGQEAVHAYYVTSGK